MDKTSFSSRIPCGFVIDRSLQVPFLSFPPSLLSLCFAFCASCQCDVDSDLKSLHQPLLQDSPTGSLAIDLKSNIQASKPPNPSLLSSKQAQKHRNGLPQVRNPFLHSEPFPPSFSFLPASPKPTLTLNPTQRPLRHRPHHGISSRRLRHAFLAHGGGARAAQHAAGKSARQDGEVW